MEKPTNSQLQLFDRPTAASVLESGDLSQYKVMIGLSGGINSMAVLCELAQWPKDKNPKELHLFYAHFIEHSPDTFGFVADGIRYARRHFENVFVQVTKNSVLAYFEKQNMIPHPKRSPCTYWLKIWPMLQYMIKNKVQIDLVGYVREESKCYNTMIEKAPDTIFHKAFPIKDKPNEWCFEIVKKEIGWYPAIYDLTDEKGKRIFPHNNCLPCKNMQIKQIENVQKYFPEYHEKGVATANNIKSYWGRNADDWYTRFGREDYETDYEEQPCKVCAFD